MCTYSTFQLRLVLCALVVAIWGSAGLDPSRWGAKRGRESPVSKCGKRLGVMLNRVTPNWNFVFNVDSPTCFCFYQDYKCENPTLLSSARSTPEDSVSGSILLNGLDLEIAFASFSASLVSIINHQDWFLPETDLAGGVTGFEGNKCFWAPAEFLLGSMWGQSCSLWYMI